MHMLGIRSILAAFCFMFVTLPAVAATPNHLEETYHKAWLNVDYSYSGNLPQNWSSYKNKYDGKLQNVEQLRVALNEMLDAVGDRNLRLLTSAEAEALQAREANGYIGIGLGFRSLSLVGNNGLFINEVLTDTPAEEAGLKADSLIVAVDGKELAGMRFQEAVALISGPEGTLVKLTVSENAVKREVTVKRDLDEKIGVVIELKNPQTVFEIDLVMKDGPGERAGFKEHDIVTAINGLSTEGMGLDQFIAHTKIGHLGTKVVLEINREGKPETVTLVRSIVPDSVLNFGYSSQNYDGPEGKGLIHFQMKNLDWQEAVRWTEKYVQHSAQYGGIILDLRDCSGQNAETAAQIASLFLRDGHLLSYSERRGADTTTYKVENGGLLRIRSGSVSLQQVVYTPKFQDPDKKLVVLVNERTSGAAEALALALQKNQRAAVVGHGTAGNAELTSTLKSEVDEIRLYISIPSTTLVTAEGKPVSYVSPDRRPHWNGSGLDTAKAELVGLYWYNDPGLIVPVVFVGLLFLVVGTIIWLSSRNKVNPDNADGTSGQEEEVTVRTKEDEPDQEEPATPMTRKQKITTAAIVATVILAFIGIGCLADYWQRTPPAGAQAEVVVELYTDGSENSQSQAAVFNQLQKEYSGPISFKTYDVKQQPEFTPLSDNDTWRNKVEPVPCVRVVYRWKDKEGKLISGGTQGLGKATKRDVVSLISLAVQNLHNHHKWEFPTPIVRNKKP